MDFKQNPEEFERHLAQIKRDLKRARDEFDVYLKHWQSLSSRHFGDSCSFSEVDDYISGAVLGKDFRLYLQPIAQEKSGFLEVVIAARSINKTNVEIGRFFVRKDGSIVSNNGEVLIDSSNTGSSYTLVSTILRTVLQSPAPSAV